MAAHSSESEHKELFMLLSKNIRLPVDTIKLTRAQQATLSKVINDELYKVDPLELREVYIECSQKDKELRGFCAIETFSKILDKHGVVLTESDALRLVVAQFMDPYYPGKVNYEKTLSFIGSALQLNEKGQLSQDRQTKYDMQNVESFKTGSVYRHRDEAILLRVIEEELIKTTYTIDKTRWYDRLNQRDRNHQDTLSAAQIKDICYQMKLPLSENLVNQILDLYEDNKIDGQYSWQAFLEFLSRVRTSDVRTPQEYATRIPNTVTNRPRAAIDTQRQRRLSPHREEPRPDDRNATRDNYQQLDGRISNRDGYTVGPGVGQSRGDDSPRAGTREEQINQISEQLHDLETKFMVTKEGISSNSLPWLDRYLKLAQALYNRDIFNKGRLPRTEVMDVVNQYNNDFNLNMDMIRAGILATDPEHLDKAGNIILRPFLANLSADKIIYSQQARIVETSLNHQR